MKVLAIANNKGGVAKSTTAINLSAFLAKYHNKKVLLIDLDPQGNTTEGMGIALEQGQLTVGDLIINERVKVKDIVIDGESLENPVPGLHILPSDLNLSLAEFSLSTMFSREFKLRKKLQGLDYDYIIFDCMPSFTLLTVNAFVCATEILMPVRLGFFSMKGIYGFMNCLDIINHQICNELKHRIEIKHVLYTFFNLHTKLHKDVYDTINQVFNNEVLKTKIPVNIKLDEAQSAGMPIYSYDQSCTGYESYKSLTEEILERHEKEKIRQNSG